LIKRFIVSIAECPVKWCYLKSSSIKKRKSYISPDKDAFLDSFVDLDTRVSQRDFMGPEDEQDELDYLFGGIEDILDDDE
jgi:hypothetical protein